MPTDGIHGTFTRNWKSERPELKWAIRCSERTKVTSATISEKARIARTFLRLKKSSRIAPSAGRNVTIVSIAGFSASISPQEPGDYDDAAEQEPACIGTNVSCLHVTQAARDTANCLAYAVNRPVDHGHVDKLPQEFPRRSDDGPDENRFVNLIHVVLAREN